MYYIHLKKMWTNPSTPWKNYMSGVGVRIRYAKNIWVKQIELVRLPNLMETVVSCHGDHYLPIPVHTTYNWNIKWQKCAGISGLWVLNAIIPKKYFENMKKNCGSRLEVAC